MEIRVCLVDAVIALAAIGGDKREALCGNILKHVVLRVRKRLVETKQRPLQFESPSLVASWFAQSTFCPPSQTAFPKNLLKFLKMWKIFYTTRPMCVLMLAFERRPRVRLYQCGGSVIP